MPCDQTPRASVADSRPVVAESGATRLSSIPELPDALAAVNKAEKVYLSPTIDCFDAMVVSWSIGTRPDADLVNTMLDAAIETIAANSDRPVVHSDRGAHDRWPGWLSRITDAKLARSMSRKGVLPGQCGV